MTHQFRFTPAQRAAFRADPPGYAVGAADRVLTDIERIIGHAGVGAVEEFAFSDEEREAVNAELRKFIHPCATDIEAAVNRVRADGAVDPVGTVRRSPDGWVSPQSRHDGYPGSSYAIACKTDERNWRIVHVGGPDHSYTVGDDAEAHLCNWRSYPEADS
jgi:hypothetical protein